MSSHHVHTVFFDGFDLMLRHIDKVHPRNNVHSDREHCAPSHVRLPHVIHDCDVEADVAMRSYGSRRRGSECVYGCAGDVDDGMRESGRKRKKLSLIHI